MKGKNTQKQFGDRKRRERYIKREIYIYKEREIGREKERGDKEKGDRERGRDREKERKRERRQREREEETWAFGNISSPPWHICCFFFNLGRSISFSLEANTEVCIIAFLSSLYFYGSLLISSSWIGQRVLPIYCILFSVSVSSTIRDTM